MKTGDLGSDLSYLLSRSAIDLDSLRFTKRHNLIARRSLERLRQSLDLVQADFAAMLGISQTTLAGYEAGARQIPVMTFLTAAQLAETPIAAAFKEPTVDDRKRELAKVQRLRARLPKGSRAAERVERLIHELKNPVGQ